MLQLIHGTSLAVHEVAGAEWSSQLEDQKLHLIVHTHRVLYILSKNYILFRDLEFDNLPKPSRLRLAWIAFLKDGRYSGLMLPSFKRLFARSLFTFLWVLERPPTRVTRFVGAKIST